MRLQKHFLKRVASSAFTSFSQRHAFIRSFQANNFSSDADASNGTSTITLHGARDGNTVDADAVKYVMSILRGDFSHMVETKKLVQDSMNEFKRHDLDTGSAEVQIAALSVKIERLQKHFAEQKNDIHSRRGLLRMQNERDSMMKYLKRTNPERYVNVVEKLGLGESQTDVKYTKYPPLPKN